MVVVVLSVVVAVAEISKVSSLAVTNVAGRQRSGCGQQELVSILVGNVGDGEGSASGKHWTKCVPLHAARAWVLEVPKAWKG